jgi:hypothetical protein
MQYNKVNNILGWLCFAIASITYILTLEPSVSFWDCGEFISCAFRLQVSHQPGYPLFAMLGKAFSLLSFGDNTKVPYFTNMGSAIASGATIMFLFWTITALAKKLVLTKAGEVIDQTRLILIMGSGLVGALAFTYTDTFWYSAVETIVFALSSLCTAIVFWAILKWDAHADEAGADKWIVFIAYVMGLSIGIHLLNLLTIPAIAMVYYFRRSKKVNKGKALLAFLAGIAILGLVQYGIRGYTIHFAALFDLFFVNTLGMGFGSGAIVFFALVIAIIVAGIWYSIRYKKPMLNLAFLCVAFIYFGYSSFAYIPIRATADTNLNNSRPDNAFTLYGYLNRIQYGETPLLTGPYFDSKIIDQTTGSINYRRGKTKYEDAGRKVKYVYDRTTFLPRTYSTENQDPPFYKQWLQLPEGQSPTFTDNIKFLASWQIYQMYVRYFLWNFVGRYNDQDGQQSTANIDGNWTTGIFNTKTNTPASVLNDPSYTPLYAIPLIIGLFGMIYHFSSRRRDALVVLLLWFFTGIAIVLYVNQGGIQPRERDYSYVGSFYAFAIWIGLGVLALAETLRKWLTPNRAAIGATALCFILGPVLLASKEWKAHDRSTKWTAHDMAYNYLISCPPNAILFTYGDNETYSVWYDQEVEGIRPDVRIVNLSLFSGDWYIRQMQKKMNQSAPLPISMPQDKYKEGVRDVIYFINKNVNEPTELKEVTDFITSDDKRAMGRFTKDGQFAGYDDIQGMINAQVAPTVTGPARLAAERAVTEKLDLTGPYVNYLPTKDLKLTVNADDVIKNGVVTADQKDRIAPAMEWKIPTNYVTKDKLALLDILAHNNWKRPICFAATMGSVQMAGLTKYLYKEGFTYRLIPFKADTANKDQLGKVNTMAMYDNVMNKFKFGNFKNARYLDQQSSSLFYPYLVSTFVELADNLMKEKHPDMALKVLHKYDAVLPDFNPYIDVAARKVYLAQIAYQLNDNVLANKFISNIDKYLIEQLDYNYYLLQKDTGSINLRDVQFGVQLLGGMADITRDGKQTALTNKLQAQLKDYEAKFAGVLSRQQ